MTAAQGTRLEAYIVLSLPSGVRTEETRALRWGSRGGLGFWQWISVLDMAR
jgi:hypothetical protein